MKKYLVCSLFFLMLFISFSASAQYGRGNGRYKKGYAPYHRYPSRTSVSIIARLPFGAIGVTFGDRRYHYYNGVYYRPYSRGYVIVQPPVGIVVPVIPYGARHVIIGANPYYRHGNIYYAPYDNRYRVVEEPSVDDRDENINDNVVAGEYEKIVIEGKIYYKKGEKYYKASVNKSGEVIYEEVGETSKSE